MKKWIVYGIVIITLCVTCYLLFIPRIYSKTITVNVPLTLLNKQFSEIKNYPKWLNTLKNVDSTQIRIIGKDRIESKENSIQIVTITERSCLLRIEKKETFREVLYTIIADTINKNTLTVSYKNTLWNALFGNNTSFKDAEKSIASLKEYTEDTRKVYGFHIYLDLVTDTTFLFTSKTVPVEKKKAAINENYIQLVKYADAKNAGYTGTKIFYTTAMGKDSVRLYQGVGISKNVISLPFYGSIAVKRMPYQKNLAVADYNGKFGEIAEVFSALEQYSIDQGMISMAIPFIKIEPSQKEFDDSIQIQAKVYFPVR